MQWTDSRGARSARLAVCAGFTRRCPLSGVCRRRRRHSSVTLRSARP